MYASCLPFLMIFLSFAASLGCEKKNLLNMSFSIYPLKTENTAPEANDRINQTPKSFYKHFWQKRIIESAEVCKLVFSICFRRVI